MHNIIPVYKPPSWGYYVSTSGRDEEVIRSYIRKQEEFDKRIDQLQMF